MGSASTRQRALRLIERVHAREHGLAQEYPLVFDPAFDGRILALEENGHVRSACALLVRDFLGGKARTRVGLIGSVSTDPDWRGCGWGTRLLAHARNELALQGCALALLWADDAAFYRTRGFCEVGAELDFLIEPERLASLPVRSGIRAVAGDDHHRLHRLYSRHPERVDRKLEETRALLASPGMQTLVLEERGDVAAYACLGRGADLQGVVHEWAGAPDHVLALLRAHHERARARGVAGALVLMAPLCSVSLREALANLGISANVGLLGLARIADWAAAAELLIQAAEGTARVSMEEPRGGSVAWLEVAGPAGSAVLGEAELLAMLAPARGVTGVLEEIRARTGARFPGLPLGLFAWGLDSI